MVCAGSIMSQGLISRLPASPGAAGEGGAGGTCAGDSPTEPLRANPDRTPRCWGKRRSVWWCHRGGTASPSWTQMRAQATRAGTQLCDGMPSFSCSPGRMCAEQTQTDLGWGEAGRVWTRGGGRPCCGLTQYLHKGTALTVLVGGGGADRGEGQRGLICLEMGPLAPLSRGLTFLRPEASGDPTSPPRGPAGEPESASLERSTDPVPVPSPQPSLTPNSPRRRPKASASTIPTGHTPR